MSCVPGLVAQPKMRVKHMVVIELSKASSSASLNLNELARARHAYFNKLKNRTRARLVFSSINKKQIYDILT